jgi:hypothetical protein
MTATAWLVDAVQNNCCDFINKGGQGQFNINGATADFCGIPVWEWDGNRMRRLGIGSQRGPSRGNETV